MPILKLKSLWSAMFPPMISVAAAHKHIKDMAAQMIALATQTSVDLELERARIIAVLTSEREAHLTKLDTMIEKDSALEIINRSMRDHAEETEALLDLRLKHLQAENDATLDDLSATIRQARADFSKALLVASTRGSAIVAEAPGLSPADRRSLLDVFRQMHASSAFAA